MIIDNWTEVKNSLLDDTVVMKLVSSGNVTVCNFEFTNPGILPEHHHMHEQLTLVLEGEIIIEYLGNKRTLKANDVCIVPSYVTHSAEITQVPFRSMDVFCPAREDFLDVIQESD